MRWIGFDGNAWASACALNSTARKSRLRTQRLRELAYIAHVFQAADERDDALHRIRAEMAGCRGAQLLFDLRPRKRIGWIALRRGAAIAVRLAVRGAHFDGGTGAFHLRIDLDLHALARKGAHRRVLVALRLELLEPAAPVVQHDRRHVRRGKKRLELVVPGQGAVHVVHGLRQSDANRRDPLRREVMRAHQGEQAGDDRLDRARRGPEAQPDLLELPALAEICGHRLRIAAVGIGIEDAAVLVAEDVGRGGETLFGEKARQQSRERAARLVELDGGCAPVREGAGRLAAGQSKRIALALGIEAEELADCRRATERADHAGRMPAFRAKRRVFRTQADARGRFEARGNGEQQIAAAGAIALGDRERRRDDLRRRVAERRPMYVADGDGGDQVAVEERRARERKLAIADDGGFLGCAERGGERVNLLGLVPLAPRDGARQRIEQDVFHALARRSGELLVLEAGDEGGEFCSDAHSSLAPESFTALDHFTISDLMSAVNSSGVEIAGSAARLTRRSRMSGIW